FWASWCGPCRAEIPNLKKEYKKYHDKGFEIVSFSLDHKREAWEKALKEEQMPWINISDLKAYTSPIVKDYGISGIPAEYLVDSETGKIVASLGNLRGDNLGKKLSEL